MMTEGQASSWLVQNGAAFVKTQGTVQWWRLSDDSWVSKQRLANGMYELRRHAANGCGC